MKDSDIGLMQEMEKKYWWHVSRRFILRSILTHRISFNKICSPSILDVGCGSGINMQWLSEFGTVTGVDSSPTAIEFCKHYGRTILADANRLPLPSSSVDLITAFDVLEHLKDDKVAIKEWGRTLQPNGYLFLSVPAYPWLFSNRDRKLGHYRRYNLPGLKKILDTNGFKLVFGSYIFTLVFPIFMIQRIFFQKETSDIYPTIPEWLNNFLMYLSNLEAYLLKFIRLPFGGSIVVLARKLK